MAEQDFGRHDFEAIELGGGFVERLGPFFDPAEQQPIFPAPDLHPLAPFVIDRERRLLQDQALRRIRHIDARRFSGQQGFVVGVEIVAEQRESKTALPLERAVASPAVAAEPAEQRQHVPAKIGRFGDLFGGKSLAGRRRQLRGPCPADAADNRDKRCQCRSGIRQNSDATTVLP